MIRTFLLMALIAVMGFRIAQWQWQHGGTPISADYLVSSVGTAGLYCILLVVCAFLYFRE